MLHRLGHASLSTGHLLMDPPIKLVVLAGAERVALFVKECYTGVAALIPQGPRPVIIHRSPARAALAAYHHPLQVIDVLSQIHRPQEGLS